MTEFKLTVYANKFDDHKCGHDCKFLVKNFWLEPKRCAAFDKPLPVAAGEAYRLPMCKEGEEKR